VPDTIEDIPEDVHTRLRREAALKRRVFQLVFEDEFRLFLQKPEVVRARGSLLGIVYSRLITCPMFLGARERGNTVENVERVVQRFPQLFAKLPKPNQVQVELTLRSGVVSSFRMLEKTGLETKYEFHKRFAAMARFMEAPNQEGMSEAKETSRKNRQRLVALLAMVSGEMEKNGGTEHLFRVFRESKTLKDLPPLYKKVFEACRRSSLPLFAKILQDRKKMAALKRFHSRLPKKVLKGIFGISNPMKVMAKLTSLLSKDLVGSKTLFQHMLIAFVDVDEAERRAANLGRNLPKRTQEVVMAFVADNYKLMVAQHVSDYTDSLQHIKTILELSEVSTDGLPDEHLYQIQQFHNALVRVKERESLAEMVDSEEMHDLVKVASPILQDLMVEIYVVSDLPKLFLDGLSLLKKIIKASETQFKTEQERDTAYRILTVELCSLFFLLLHNIAQKDGSPIQKFLQWMLNAWNNREQLNSLDYAFGQLTEEQLAGIWKEADTLKEYYKRGGNGLGLAVPSPPMAIIIASVKSAISSSSL